MGEYRVKLTNTSDRRSLPLTRLYSLFLRLGGVTGPRIMSCSGAGSASYFPHAREFPSDAFRPRWIEPFHYRPVEFASHRNLTGCPTGSCDIAVPVKQRGFGERWTGSSSQDLSPVHGQPGSRFGPARDLLRAGVVHLLAGSGRLRRISRQTCALKSVP